MVAASLSLPRLVDCSAMNNAEGDLRERALRERIANLIRSNEQARKKPITEQEKQALLAAADRLQQKLSEATSAEREALKGAASRLDQLLADLRAGKDVTRILKRQ